ncbi:hypothetical protein MJG53_015501 [Ovis ammon polii x Ovis aries]|uniref:Uncharacterized protein n=1 Tax=Ovis ammon polii x Ovis aries TaxID=2918886 RepID=A0ACB9UFZ3_9CETA|nr:hypothetical protein MJG53_015501 [Ovis ammon polii x Ovis aries]
MSTGGSPVRAYDFLLKFLLVGDSDVGKGEILASLQDGAAESPYGHPAEVRWPGLDTDDGMTCMQSGTVRISSLDGHAYLCLPKSQHEFTVHFLCKVSQQPDSSIEASEKNNKGKKDKQVEKTGKICTHGSLSGQRLKNKENELYHQIMKSKEHSEKSCVNGAKRREVLSSPRTKDICVDTWVKQCWSVASCPEEWKYPLSLALRFHNKISSMSGIDADITQKRMLTSDVSEERGKEVSVLPRAPLLSCPAPHLHRWNFSDSLSQKQFGEEEYSYHGLVKVVWYKGVTYRLTHKHMNSIEIYPGDGSVFKSEGAYLGNYFTYYSIQEESEEREEKTYSVNNLPPDRPGSPFSVCSLIKQATRILQHCAKMRLSLSHNYRICCPGINDSSVLLPLLLRESFVPCVGRFRAYSDDKVHAIFLDGITLTLNWNFGSFIEKRQHEIVPLICTFYLNKTSWKCLALKLPRPSFTGIDYKTTTILLDGRRVKLQLWDTSGQGRFCTIFRSYSRGAQGVILVYDIANRWSFDGIDRWIKEINEHAPGVPKILVGNRLHLAFKRQVPTEQAQAYAERLGVTFFEVSPLCNFNITESFMELARIVLLRHGMDRLWRPSKGEGLGGADEGRVRRQGKVTVKHDGKELRKHLNVEEWILEQLTLLYDCQEKEIPELEIDVDELLDMESDDTRAARVKELLVDC